MSIQISDSSSKAPLKIPAGVEYVWNSFLTVHLLPPSYFINPQLKPRWTPMLLHLWTLPFPSAPWPLHSSSIALPPVSPPWFSLDLFTLDCPLWFVGWQRPANRGVWLSWENDLDPVYLSAMATGTGESGLHLRPQNQTVGLRWL